MESPLGHHTDHRRPRVAPLRALLFAGAVTMLIALPAEAQDRHVEMTLRQAVDTAVRSSRAVRSALLQRAASRNGLRVALHEFRPFLDVSAGAAADDRSADGTALGRDAATDAAARLRLALRSGGNVAYEVSGGVTARSGDDPTRRYGHALTVTQPLLQGRGGVATSAQRRAKLGDQSASHGLEASLSDIVNETVFAYRELLSAREEVAIAERSLAAARELADITVTLIDAGRLPAVERVQSETDIANRELSLLVSQNASDQAQLSLVSTLDLPLDTEIVPVDTLLVQRREVDPEQALRTLLARSPEYRDLLLSVEASRIDLRVAEDGARPELSANAGLRQDWTGSRSARDWSLGLNFTHVLFDPGLDASRVNARLSLAEAELALAKAEDTLRIDLRQRLRNLDVAWRRLELARRARELSARQLDIEREKLRAGRSASFQVVRFQDDLDDAANGELAASIAYANDVTRLDRALGQTLDAWHIDISRLAPWAEQGRLPPPSLATGERGVWTGDDDPGGVAMGEPSAGRGEADAAGVATGEPGAGRSGEDPAGVATGESGAGRGGEAPAGVATDESGAGRGDEAPEGGRR